MATAEVITALLQLANQLLPTLQQDFQKGAVTDAQQAALQASIAALPNDFTGAEWTPTTGH
jgi:hypothetical protein